MALAWSLYYYDSGWIDITEYVLNIAPIKYAIDNRVQGASTILQIILDSNANYGTNKYKLQIGSNYSYYAAFPDGIEELQGYKVAITLVDYLFYQLAQKDVLKITSPEGEPIGSGGGSFNLTAFTDCTIPYTTNYNDADFDGFTSEDEKNYWDGVGNKIYAYTTPKALFNTKGIVVGRDNKDYWGHIFVKADKILDDILTGEGFTMNIDYGYGDETDTDESGISLESNTKKVWDVKMVKDNILVLYSYYSPNGNALVKLRTYAPDGTLRDTLTICPSVDWCEGNTGEHNLVYRIYIDYINKSIYIPTWRCTNFNPATANTFLFYVHKIGLTADGELSEIYGDNYSVTDLFNKYCLSGTYTWTNYRQRQYRWREYPSEFNKLELYADGDHTYFILCNDQVATGEVFVFDPDVHQASGSPWKYKYTLNKDYRFMALDNMNGNVVCVVYDSVISEYRKEYCKVNMDSLVIDDSLQVLGDNINSPPADKDLVGTWREGLEWLTIYSFGNQLPNGIACMAKCYNPYSIAGNDYWGGLLSGGFNVNHGGISWDGDKDRTIAWKTNNNENPTTIDWKIRDHYVYRRVYLYQPYVYIDRQQQFIDAFVTFGYFYEQRNGEIRLFRIRGTAGSLGTINESDVLLKKDVRGFTNLADIYTIKILTKDLNYGSGNKIKTINTKFGEYGFITKPHADRYTDWVTRLASSNEGLILHIDLGRFYEITSTYLPSLGKTFTYISDIYNLIGVEIDIENWQIKLTGVKDVS